MAESAKDAGVSSSGRYRLTEDDSVQALRLDSRPSRWLLVISASAGLALAALCLVGNVAIQFVAGGALLGAIAGASVVRYVVSPAFRRRSFRRNPLLHNEFTIELRDGDIRIFSSKTNAELTADRIVKWKEGADYILIYASPRVYFTIPKRKVTMTFDLEALRARLREYRGAAAA